MSTPAKKRLMRDFKRLQQDPPAGISGAPQDNNIMLWNAVIFGPDDTPWDGVEIFRFLHLSSKHFLEFLQSMQMEVFVWIFYKISGVLYMMLQLY
ncbi:hypothetical protein CUMW_048620 [Citrus unshiu]|nr:hypothetical protein CUMW_048620 [Citrus unshiu]